MILDCVGIGSRELQCIYLLRGGVKMGFFMDYVVAAIVAAVITIFMDKIVVHNIKVVLRSERMLESLEDMVNNVNNVRQNYLTTSIFWEESDNGDFHQWHLWLQEVVGKASRMVREHREFSRLRDKLNIFSRHRRSKDIDNLISDINEELKLVPAFQLDCVLSLILRKRGLPPVLVGGGTFSSGDFTAGIVGWVITSAFLVMFFYIGRLRNFKKELGSFKYLTKNIRRIVRLSRSKISKIQLDDEKRADNWLTDNWLTDVRNWLNEMGDIIDEGKQIEDTLSPIGRFRKSKEIRELTSKIDAHLNKLSSITMNLLSHEIPESANRALQLRATALPLHATAGPSQPTSPQETLTARRPSTSPQETLTTKRPSTSPQETEGSTSDAVLSYETEGSIGSTSNSTTPQETQGSIGSTSNPTTPQETQGSTSNPTAPLEDVRICVV